MEILTAVASVIAAVAGVLVIFISLRQVHLAQLARYDTRRPVLYPSDFLVGKAIQSPVTLVIRNVGAGPAMNVRAVIYSWQSRDPASTGANRFWYTIHEPIADGENKTGISPTYDTFEKITREGRIGELAALDYAARRLAAWLFRTQSPTPSVPLIIPREIERDLPEREMIWRLTISYQDLFGRKHASVFDFLGQGDMRAAVAFFEHIPKGLDDLGIDQAPHREQTPH